MSDDASTGDVWRDYRRARQAKRAINRVATARLLMEQQIPFTSQNGGAHLVVHIGSRIFDLWPGTGLWIERGTGKRNRGVRTLLTHARNPE